MMSGCETGTFFVSGNINVLHAGRLRPLHDAKPLGTRRVEGLLAGDAHDVAAIVPDDLRLDMLPEYLRKLSEGHHILLKLCEEGLLIHGHHDTGEDFITDRLPALNEAPKDVAGAGDSLLTASTMTLAAGGNIWDAALMGSIAAAIQVDRVGNIPIDKNALLKTLMSGLG